jgi:FkbM family methyltransferase
MVPLYRSCSILIALIGSAVCFDRGFVKECKRGKFLLSDKDHHVSRHLNVYGEWAERELQLFLSIVKRGDIVIDAGANIGAFTVPLANAVGPSGRVHAFEPQRIINQRLNANVALNDLYNVDIYLAALGNESGLLNVPLIDYSQEGNFAAISLADPTMFDGMLHESVPVLTLDSVDFSRQASGSKNTCPSFIKVDVELMETQVLLGARNLIRRCHPILYLENPCVKTSLPLINLVYELGYIPYWDIQATFNPDSFNKVDVDIAPGQYAINMIGVPFHRLRQPKTADSDDRNEVFVEGKEKEASYGESAARTEEQGDVAMVGFVRVELDKPYLHQYFEGRYSQAGNETTCGNTGVYYVNDI